MLFGVSLLAEVVSNDKPLVARYEGRWYLPLFQTLPESTFGGDFPTPTDYLDPLIRENLAKPGEFRPLSAQPLSPQHDQLLRQGAESRPAEPLITVLGTRRPRAGIWSRGCSTGFASPSSSR